MSFNYTTLDSALKDATEWLSREYSRVHTGRASPILLDGVQVEAYGAFQPLKNIGSISVEDARTLRISVWDKTVLKDAEKAIVSANLGLTVAVDNEGMRVIFPQLTTENRTKLVKILKDKLEDGRVTVRKAREDAMSELKKAEFPEDDERRAKEDIQKRVDEANNKLERIFDTKENEIMTE